jgi:hypothetical protein
MMLCASALFGILIIAAEKLHGARHAMGHRKPSGQDQDIAVETKIRGVEPPYQIDVHATITKDNESVGLETDYDEDEDEEDFDNDTQIQFDIDHARETNESIHLHTVSASGQSNATPKNAESWKAAPANVTLPGSKHLQPLPLSVGNVWSEKATLFDDAPFLKKLLASHPEAELASITIKQNKGCVLGVQCRYRTNQAVIDAPLHNGGGVMGWYASNWPQKPDVTLVLEPGEHIDRVIVRTGEIIDRLELHTDRGQSVIAGGPGGGDKTIEMEKGSYVFGFSGHEYAGVLVRLGFHVKSA